MPWQQGKIIKLFKNSKLRIFLLWITTVYHKAIPCFAQAIIMPVNKCPAGLGPESVTHVGKILKKNSALPVGK
jgi:hypothetical protein